MQEIRQMAKPDAKGEMKVTFRIPAQIMRDLKHTAIDKDISVNALVVQVMKAYLKEAKSTK